MKRDLIYVELKSGYGDSGPAWIGLAGYSKSGATVYFDGKAFRSLKGSGISGNYYETLSGDEYWISGVKKNNEDRHWAGGGMIRIDKEAVPQYLELLGLSNLPRNLEPTILKASKPSERHHEKENEVLCDQEAPSLDRHAVAEDVTKLKE